MDFETEELGFDLREQQGFRAHLTFSAFVRVCSQLTSEEDAEGHGCMSKRTRAREGVFRRQPSPMLGT